MDPSGLSYIYYQPKPVTSGESPLYKSEMSRFNKKIAKENELIDNADITLIADKIEHLTKTKISFTEIIKDTADKSISLVRRVKKIRTYANKTISILLWTQFGLPLPRLRKFVDHAGSAITVVFSSLNLFLHPYFFYKGWKKTSTVDKFLNKPKENVAFTANNKYRNELIEKLETGDNLTEAFNLVALVKKYNPKLDANDPQVRLSLLKTEKKFIAFFDTERTFAETNTEFAELRKLYEEIKTAKDKNKPITEFMDVAQQYGILIDPAHPMKQINKIFSHSGSEKLVRSYIHSSKEKKADLQTLLEERTKALDERSESIETILRKKLNEIKENLTLMSDKEKLKNIRELENLGFNLNKTDPKSIDDDQKIILFNEVFSGEISDDRITSATRTKAGTVETLSEITLQGLASMGRDKAIRERKYYGVKWKKVRITAPIGFILSIASIIVGGLTIASIIPGTPLFLVILFWSSFFIGLGLIVAGLIHIIRNKPERLWENALALRGIRKSFRSFQYERIEKKMKKALLTHAVSNLIIRSIERVTRSDSTDEDKDGVKEQLEKVRRHIPKKIYNRLIQNSFNQKDHEFLNKVKLSYQKKKTTQEVQIKNLQKNLKYQKKLLLIHKEKLGKAAIKDAVRGGVSMRKVIGLKPKDKQWKELGLIFPHIVKNSKYKINPESFDIFKALIEIDKMGGLPEKTKKVLREQMNIDFDKLKKRIAEESEDILHRELFVKLSRFFEGTIDDIYKIAADTKK